jgi:spermidine synthase
MSPARELSFPESYSIRNNLFILGFVSTSIQLLLLREMMNITGGYELISGTFLGSWLIASAAGSWLAGRSGMTGLRKLNCTFIISPLISVLLLLILSKLFLPAGQSPSFPASFIIILIVLSPVSVATGFTFIKLAEFGRREGLPAGNSFSVETMGGVAAGILISIITAGMLNTWQLILLIFLLSGTWLLLNFYQFGFIISLVIKTLCVIITVLILITNVDVIFRKILMPAIEVTGTRDTPYGNITTGEYSGEQSTFYNHRLLTYTGDAAGREEDIHYALLQCDDPRKVLLISGSLPSHLPELLKYQVNKVFYVERDPALIIVPDTIPGKISLEIAGMDGFRFIRKIQDSVDAILCLIPPPSTLQLNRYYSTGFFREAKKKMTRNGIFMCSPGPAEIYYNEETISMYSSIYNSLDAVFKNVLPVAGNKLYFIGSDTPLSTSITDLAKQKNIENIYVNADFLADDLIRVRSLETISVLDTAVRENTSSFPNAYTGYQINIFVKHTGTKTPSVILLAIIFALPLFLIRRKNVMMYTGAAALAGFEIILLVVLQLTAGNMYQLTGLILASFMTGLAAGAGTGNPSLQRLPLWSKAGLLVVFYLLAGWLFDSLVEIDSFLLSVNLLLILSFIPAFFTGNIFRELTGEMNIGKDVAFIYNSDLSGSAIGFILVSAVAIPLAGIKASIFILSAVVFAGLMLGTIRSND